MIKQINPFANVKLGNLYEPKNPPVFQRITKREKGYLFDNNLNDYDILRNKYDRSFFMIPSFERSVEIDEESRPDLISHKVYRDTDFWSFIMMYNRLADPITDITTGRLLNIPFYNHLTSWLTINIIQKGLS